MTKIDRKLNYLKRLFKYEIGTGIFDRFFKISAQTYIVTINKSSLVILVGKI